MIKNIVFDLGGVIVPLNRVACLRAFDEIVGYKNFGDILSTYRQTGFFEKFENGQISARRFRQIIRTNASNDGTRREVTDRQIDYSLNCFLKDIPQDRIDTLLFYRGDYRLFVLSNTNPIGMKRVEELFAEKGYRMEDIFEMQFLSYKMKVSKPSPEIFEKMIAKADILPEETLYIDDSAVNLQAAAALGFHTVLYSPNEDLYDKVSKSL